MNASKQTFNLAAVILFAAIFVLTTHSWANETGLPRDMVKIT